MTTDCWIRAQYVLSVQETYMYLNFRQRLTSDIGWTKYAAALWRLEAGLDWKL